MPLTLALAVYLLAENAWRQRWPVSRESSPPLLLHHTCPGHATPILALPVACAGCGFVFHGPQKEDTPC